MKSDTSFNLSEIFSIMSSAVLLEKVYTVKNKKLKTYDHVWGYIMLMGLCPHEQGAGKNTMEIQVFPNDIVKPDAHGVPTITHISHSLVSCYHDKCSYKRILMLSGRHTKPDQI